MKGKDRCKILKEIRQAIAQENDIAFVTAECRHKGDCPGTCPACEEEVRYLERELEKRQRLGKAVAIAGLTMSITMASTGCALFPTQGNMKESESSTITSEKLTDGVLVPPSLPELNSIIGGNEEDILISLRGVHREDILLIWQEALAEETDDSDVFALPDGRRLAVFYDPDGFPVQVEFRTGNSSTGEEDGDNSPEE